MKLLLSFVLSALLPLVASADVSSSHMGLPAEMPASEPPRWSFLIGMSSASLIDDTPGSSQEIGGGLSLSTHYSLDDHFVNQYVAVGGGLSLLKTEAKGSTAFGGYSSNYTREILYGYVEGTPIRHHIDNMMLTGSASVGLMSSAGARSGPNLYFGAAFGLALNHQTGVRLDTKVSPDFNSLNTLSLVGYY